MNFTHGISAEISFIWEWWRRNEQKKFFYPALLLFFCLLALLPLLLPGIPKGHDIFFHLARISALSDGLAHGTFPVKIYPGVADTGYANGLFYPDFFLYIPALLVWAHVPIVIAYKLFFGVIFIGAAFSMYWVLKRISGSGYTAFLGGMLYMISSFAVSDFWIRAALGEMQCFVFMPLVIWGLYEIILGNPRNFWALAAGMIGLGLAHVITFALAVIITAVFCAFFIFRFVTAPRRVLALAAAVVVTLLLLLWFYLPLAEMMRSDVFYVNTSVSASPIATRTIPFMRLFLEIPYMKTAYWHPAGIGLIFCIILFYRVRTGLGRGRQRKWLDACLIAGFGMLICCTVFLPWEGAFSAFSFMQFPWRLYLPALAFLACGSALGVARMSRHSARLRFRWLIAVIIGAGFAFALNVGYIYTAKIAEKNIYIGAPISERASITCGHYLPDGTDMAALSRVDRHQAVILRGEARLEPLIRRAGTAVLAFSGAKPHTLIELPLISYKGYSARINDRYEARLKTSARNFLAVELPAQISEGKMTIFYRGTVLQRWTGWISFIAFLAVVLCMGWDLRQRRRLLK